MRDVCVQVVVFVDLCFPGRVWRGDGVVLDVALLVVAPASAVVVSFSWGLSSSRGDR